MVKKTHTGKQRAAVQFLALTPKVGWVWCSFSPLFQEIFLQVHQFSPLLKNHHSKFKCQVFIRHRRILPLLRRILCKRFGSLWLLFFYSNVEPLSKYSPVMLHLLLLKFLMKILKCDLESTITFTYEFFRVPVSCMNKSKLFKINNTSLWCCTRYL